MSYDINLKHLEYFIKVARLGSINKAAQMLYVSQSHLGKIIHDLEETVGAPLLNRSRQGVTLTPEGNEFLERSVRILKEMEGMHLRPLKEMEKTEPLAVSMTKFSHVMESFITIVRRYQDQPEFTHRLYEGQLEDVIEDVVSGRADIGIFHFDSQRHEEIQMMAAAKGLTYRFLSYVEPQIVISKDHPLVREKKPMTRENLANYGFIRYMGLYDDILGLMRRYNLTPVITQEVGEAMTIIGLVSAGLGVSILPASFKRVQLNEMRWVPIAEEDAVSEMWLVWPKHHEQSPAARNFRIHLLNALR